MNDVLFFQIGAWSPLVDRLGVGNDDEKLYQVLGFEDSIDFAKKARRYSNGDEGAWWAETRENLVLIEGYLYETWVHGSWQERDLTFFRAVVTREFFEKEAEKNPILAIKLAKEMALRRVVDGSR